MRFGLVAAAAACVWAMPADATAFFGRLEFVVTSGTYQAPTAPLTTIDITGYTGLMYFKAVVLEDYPSPDVPGAILDRYVFVSFGTYLAGRQNYVETDNDIVVDELNFDHYAAFSGDEFAGSAFSTETTNDSGDYRITLNYTNGGATGGGTYQFNESGNPFYYPDFNYTYVITSGVINRSVPEPATWAMMIAGASAIGGSLRRRKVKVSYA